MITESTDNAQVPAGKHVFRFDTFGDERFWTGQCAFKYGYTNGGVAKSCILRWVESGRRRAAEGRDRAIQSGKIDLNSPATTVALIKLNAVVGVVGNVSGSNLRSVGISCALCHSTADNRIAPGIGSRLDGWPNRDLNPGAIIALSPAITPDKKAVYNSWGPGRYGVRHGPELGIAQCDEDVSHDAASWPHTQFNLGLTAQGKADLAAYLRTL